MVPAVGRLQRMGYWRKGRGSGACWHQQDGAGTTLCHLGLRLRRPQAPLSRGWTAPWKAPLMQAGPVGGAPSGAIGTLRRQEGARPR